MPGSSIGQPMPLTAAAATAAPQDGASSGCVAGAAGVTGGAVATAAAAGPGGIGGAVCTSAEAETLAWIDALAQAWREDAHYVFSAVLLMTAVCQHAAHL